jgi:hypothetical protein
MVGKTVQEMRKRKGIKVEVPGYENVSLSYTSRFINHILTLFKVLRQAIEASNDT